MNEAAVRVRGIGKRYRLGVTPVQGRLTEALQARIARMMRRDPMVSGRSQEEMWALLDISFDVGQGEIMGMIGRNGAGKTTLLKVLSRITAPSVGVAEIRGRIGSLLEVGTGFHPELTGRENVFLNGAILGMSRSDVKRKFDQIVEFAEVDRFLDTPVKRYSSGMFVRLAFSVAAHLDAEVLIVDEVLAVGDMAFQKRCLDSMNTAAASGRTVFLVSHNMAAIHRLCDRCALLENGRLESLGPTAEIVGRYTRMMASSTPASRPDSPVAFTRVALELNGVEQGSFTTEEEIEVVAEYVVREPLANADIGLWLLSPDGFRVLSSFDTDSTPSLRENRATGKYEARIRIPAGFLNAGDYVLRLLAYESHRRVYDENRELVLQVVNKVGDDALTGWGHRIGAVNPMFQWETHRAGGRV